MFVLRKRIFLRGVFQETEMNQRYSLLSKDIVSTTDG